MHLLNDTVTIFKPNRTRAELYELWLDDLDTRVALTRGDAAEVLDGSTAVAIIGRDFADGDAPELLELIRRRNPQCRVAVTRDRSEGFPGVDPDHHLVTPVFEDELQALVGRLVRQVNYRVALVEYYRATGTLASVEFVAEKEGASDADGASETDRESELKRRVSRLRKLLTEYRKALDREDIAAVMESISIQSRPSQPESDGGAGSKYHPDGCSECGRDWDVTESSTDARGFAELGSFVWRCVDCGHVQMEPDPSHQRVGSYER